MCMNVETLTDLPAFPSKLMYRPLLRIICENESMCRALSSPPLLLRKCSSPDRYNRAPSACKLTAIDYVNVHMHIAGDSSHADMTVEKVIKVFLTLREVPMFWRNSFRPVKFT